MTDPKHARSKSEYKRVKAQGGEILPPRERMPERAWLFTDPSTGDWIDEPTEDGDGFGETVEYIRADLAPAIDVEALRRVVEDWEEGEHLSRDAMNMVCRILTEAQGGNDD